MESIPPLSEDLIEALDEQFPPVTSEDARLLEMRPLAYKAGQRSVVEFLRMRLQQSKEDDLDVYT